jgi:hypothetical protein
MQVLLEQAERQAHLLAMSSTFTSAPQRHGSSLWPRTYAVGCSAAARSLPSPGRFRGGLTEAILKIAKVNYTDLIDLAYRGLNSVVRLLLDLVSKKVSNGAECRVLTMH